LIVVNHDRARRCRRLLARGFGARHGRSPYFLASKAARVRVLHINSIELDADGNFFISARNTWGIYKIDRGSGEVIWRLGGKRSDFAIGPGTCARQASRPRCSRRRTRATRAIVALDVQGKPLGRSKAVNYT
jgi:hypothetical protein